MTPLEAPSKEPVRKGRVLGQHRTVQVGTHAVGDDRPFPARLAVVAMPFDDRPERRLIVVEPGSATVVLEADQPAEVGVDHGVPDHPAFATDGLGSEHADPREL